MNALFLALVLAGSPSAAESRDGAQKITLGGGAKTEVAIFDADEAAPITDLTQPAVRAFELVPPKFDPATIVRPIA